MKGEVKYELVGYSRVSSLDLPREICLQVDQFLLNSSTPLILDGTLAGSGTFIKCGNVYGILTAHHVVHNPKTASRIFDFSLESEQQLGLIITEKRNHSFTIPMSMLTCVDVGVPQNARSGPDLSVLILPEIRARSIEDRKFFTDISVKRQKRMKTCRSRRGGWCAAGFPQCYVGPHESSTNKKRVTYVPSVTLYSQLTRRLKTNGFDFVHFNVEHAHMKGNVPPPSSYRGMSGAGVWKVCILRDPRTSAYSIDVKGTVLAGVAYYEVLSHGKPKRLICHGWESVYKNVCRELIKYRTRKKIASSL